MKIAFKSFGCKLNQYEIQALREGFEKFGYTEVEPDQPSDFYVLNTCTVTSGADSDARAAIRAFNRLNHNARIIVTGCYAEADAHALEQLPGVEKVVGNAKKNQILHYITGSADAKEEESPFFKDGISEFGQHQKAFIKVQDGCNYFCTFCKIPYVRGRLVSRPMDDIAGEVRRLIAKGFQEIVLTGVCLGSYGQDWSGPTTVKRNSSLMEHHQADKGNRLVELIKILLQIEGGWRLRLSSIDPRDTPLEIVELMQHHPKMCRHLHLSLQSGSDDILRAMARGYTAEEYASLTGQMKALVPDIGLTTDVIVGFPGETDANFNETRLFLQQMDFTHIHLFPYSDRPRTKAVELDFHVDRSVVKNRLRQLKSEHERQKRLYLERQIGKVLTVLVEANHAKSGCLSGYSDNYIRCEFKGDPMLIGRLVQVKAQAVNLNKILCSLIH